MTMLTSPWITSPWTWAIAGLALCMLETLAPGVFLLWIGLAAFANAVLLLTAPLSIEWLLITFCAFTTVSVLIGRRIYGAKDTSGDAPFLNRRAEALVGRETRLQAAIENGVGLAQIDDTVWRVAGPELPQGARVKIVGFTQDGTMLRIEAA
jgi:membrane protein implicated in regulation of membrane protease activity